MFKRFFWLLVIDVLILGYIGGAPINWWRTALGQAAAAYYFLHFLVILPIVSAFETPDPLPNSISESVLHGEAAEAAPMGQKGNRGGSVATAAE
jgi:ubiquinol-cytochrome c reductase cytochrome b subunit